MTAPTQIAHYKITGKLGEGGMGAVYRATDTKLNREVAVKVLPPALSNDADYTARFQREAQVLASLNHPNIATIFGLEGIAIVMELVDGSTLRGPMPLEDALPLAKQIAEALEAAHEKGVIHRDLKPGNVMVTASGLVKVLDFGLAKAVDERPVSTGPNSPTLTMRATEAGLILGTAGYMAPEQAAGKSVDKRADIWSFGVVLYELLTGKRMFDGETVSHTLADVLRAEIDLTPIPQGPVRDLLRRCLERDPKRRLRDIGEARLALENPVAAPVAVVVKPARPWALAAVAGVALCLAGVLGWRLWREAPAELPVLQYTIEAPPKMEFGATRSGPARISPDGTKLLHRMGEGQASTLWIRRLDEAEPRHLKGTEGVTYPFWSGDSKHIGFFADGKLKRIAVEGGPAQTICPAPSGRGGAWHGGVDGVIVFAPGATGPLSRVAASGGEATPITSLDASRKETSHRLPHFFPDGRRFLFFALSATADLQTNTEQSGVLVGEVPSGQAGPLPAKRLMAAETEAVWSPTGHLLFVRERNLLAQRFDLDRLQFSGEPVAIAENIRTGTNRSTAAFSISTGGVLIYRQDEGPGEQRRLAWFDRQGKELEAIPAGDGPIALSLSPDARLAVVGKIQGALGLDLWMIDLVRRSASKFSFDPAAEITPVWSPDGRRIAYSIQGAKGDDVVVKSASGVGDPVTLLRSEGAKRLGGWTRDGKWILYAQGESRSSIVAVPAEGGGKPVELVPAKQFVRTPVPSPDGRYFAYASDESGEMEVYVRTFSPGTREEGGKWQVSIGGGTTVMGWRADGKELFYHALIERAIMAVPIQGGPSFQAGTPVRLFQSQSFGGAVSPDGQRFLVAASPLTNGAQNENVVINWPAALLRKK